ncbi:hypothetical protein EZS27_016154 [termite gut metagenome]|uniref:Uncharacterized protein n=1 Tax=termite gut metagenome TaxID=433724 RepID=A0A5J4RRI1_9ZZZZ
MLTVNEVTEIFYLGDEFSKEFDKTFKKTSFESVCRQTNRKQA